MPLSNFTSPLPPHFDKTADIRTPNCEAHCITTPNFESAPFLILTYLTGRFANTSRWNGTSCGSTLWDGSLTYGMSVARVTCWRSAAVTWQGVHFLTSEWQVLRGQDDAIATFVVPQPISTGSSRCLWDGTFHQPKSIQWEDLPPRTVRRGWFASHNYANGRLNHTYKNGAAFSVVRQFGPARLATLCNEYGPTPYHT